MCARFLQRCHVVQVFQEGQVNRLVVRRSTAAGARSARKRGRIRETCSRSRSPGSGSPYDLNNDGSVDGLDLGILLGNFTPGA
jgi:hypothetical protein